MPCRPLHETVCRTCLSHIRQLPVQQAPSAQQWVASFTSRASARRARTRTQDPRPKVHKPLQGDLIKNLEQMSLGNTTTAAAAQTQPTDFDVRFFEEEDGKRTELPDDGSFEQGLSGMDASGLKETLSQMKNALGSEEEREAFEEVMAQIGGGWNKMRTVDDIEKMLSGQDRYTSKIDAEIEETLSQLPEHIQDGLKERFAEWMPQSGEPRYKPQKDAPEIPQEPWTINQWRKIKKMNFVVDRVAWQKERPPGLTAKHVRAVYKTYSSARKSLSQSWASVPLDMWDFLWEVFSAPVEINKQRGAHMSLLAGDMNEAKVSLSPVQQLLNTEALFDYGSETKAMENWRRCVAAVGDEKLETFKDYWELGVRMFCRHGDVEKAERAAKILLDKKSNPRILLPIIQALAVKNTPEYQEKSWLTYRRMRELLGQRMQLKDYDMVVSYFLTTNQTENALYSFVDMMSDGKIDLTRLKTMPYIIANKFFLGKWLKRLIGAGNLDGAYNVVEFMRTKGVTAAPIQLNGLIGAWQRSGTSENMEKADQLAWAMIESRLDHVKARNAAKAGGNPVESTTATTTETETAEPHTAQLPPMPHATLETFCVLADNYRMRNLNNRMGDLWEAFRAAEISADAFMLNQLLESYINIGEHREVQTLYRVLVKEKGIKPDAYTFSVLWKTLGINRGFSVDNNTLNQESKAAYALFAEMMRFRDMFQPDGMDAQLCRKILHTFRRLKDNNGFLAALTTMKEVFNFAPTEMLVLEMIIGTTKLSWETPSLRKQLLVAKRDLDNELLALTGGDASYQADSQGEKRGVVLYEYLQKKFWPEASDVERTRAMVEVARQMGVYDILVGVQEKR